MSKPKKIILTSWILISFILGIYNSLADYQGIGSGLIYGVFYLIPVGIIAFVLIKIWDKRESS